MPVKWGMKASMLADSTTDYIYKWHLYAGIKKIHKLIGSQTHIIMLCIFTYTYMYMYVLLYLS